MDRRTVIALALAGLSWPATAQTPVAPTPAELLGATGEPYFIDWLNGFYAQALAAGVSRTVLDQALSGL